jgi:hypothetical protein
MHALTTGPTVHTFDLSAYLNAAGVIDTNLDPLQPAYPVRYTVMGFLEDLNFGGYQLKGGSSTNLTGTVQASNGFFLTAINGWATTVSNSPLTDLIPGQNGAIVGFENPNSHTSRMGLPEKLNGGFTAAMAANLDQLLHIIQVNSELNDLPAVSEGQAMLFANGTFQITGGQLAAIPVPAAVVLFGTGVIGLVGIARRNLFGQTA